jgi:adenylate kinase
MKLILFGGVKGVGKTTIISWLQHKFAGEIRVLDPGELFRRYFYTKKVKTIDEIEELLMSKIMNMPHASTVVVHWHYAVKRPSGYIPQINFSRLKRIAKSGKVTKIVLLVVDAPIHVIRERRLKDRQTKKRGVARSIIREEIDTDERLLARHRALFSKALSPGKVQIFRLTNVDLPKTKIVIEEYFKKLLHSTVYS